MEPFDLFNPILENAPRYGKNYYVLAAEGYADQWHYSDVSEVVKINGEFQRIIYTNAFLHERKSESDRMTTLKLLIYDKSSESLDWKVTYRNTKGVYFKKHRDKFYIR